MQQVVYADVLVFVNTVVNFILLLTVRLFAGVQTQTSRLVCASFAGGLYALVMLAPEMPLPLTLLTKAVMCISLVLIAFRLHSVKKTAKCVLLFLGVSFLYAGVLYFLTYLSAGRFVQMRNGVGYYHVGAGTLVLLTAAVYLIIRFAKKKLFSFQKSDMLYDLQIRRGEHTVSARALLDSGNSVRDIYFQRPVIIVTDTVARGLIDVLPDAVNADETLPPETGFRLLPVRSIGTRTLLPAFTADSATVRKEETFFELHAPCVTVTRDPLGGEKYAALINEEAVSGG